MFETAHIAAVRRMRPGLGTYVEVGVLSPFAAGSAIDAAFAAIERVQSSLSFHDQDSELSKLNGANGAPVKLSPLALRVLRLARSMMLASHGLFNCTVGGALVHQGFLPDHGGAEPLAVGAARDIEIHGDTARLRKPIRVTLDGIAKGYAVDLAVRALRQHGVQAGWVNAGGDLRAFGNYTLPVVRRPGNPALPMQAGVRDAALATSVNSDDENFPGAIVDGQHTRRIAGIWSVLSHAAWRADALTKVAALASDAEREMLLRRLGGRLVFTAAGMAS